MTERWEERESVRKTERYRETKLDCIVGRDRDRETEGERLFIKVHFLRIQSSFS